MNDLGSLSRNPLTWTSITVLPPLIVVSAVAVSLIAFRQGLSLHVGFGLLVGVVAVVEIGYLLCLVAASRRGGRRHMSRER